MTLHALRTITITALLVTFLSVGPAWAQRSEDRPAEPAVPWLADAAEPPERQDVQPYAQLTRALKPCALAISGLFVLFGTIWTWNKTRALPASSGNSQSMALSPVVSIAPGINVKTLSVSGRQVLVGYDRNGLRDMILLPEQGCADRNFERELADQAASLQRPTVGALLGESDQGRGSFNRSRLFASNRG